MDLGKICVQYGCGLSAPDGWINFDASPTLRLQRAPLIGRFLTSGRVVFPEEVRYGDVTTVLPIDDQSCDAVYASHVLEHLSLSDYKKALIETIRIMKPGAVFRAVVPDLKILADNYIKSFNEGSSEASHAFMRNACLGIEARPKGVKGLMVSALGNAEHLWMWDEYSFKRSFHDAGFSSVRQAKFGDSEEAAFAAVEAEERFQDAIALEAIK